MKLEVSHDLLAIGPSFEVVKDYVLRFFDKTQLVRYDAVHVVEDQAVSAEKSIFWERIEQDMAGNRQVIGELIEELKESGINSLSDLMDLPQGFQSKTIHTVAHLLDGFFGIDTVFYNLVEDSHWLSANLRQEILADPSDYWLIKATGTFKVLQPEKAAILRKFENNS